MYVRHTSLLQGKTTLRVFPCYNLGIFIGIGAQHGLQKGLKVVANQFY